MSSISGKTSIDWASFAQKLAPVDVIDEPVLIKKRSRDFFWYSPILNKTLKRCFGDLVALPKSNAELSHCLTVAYAAGVPIVIRGGGTGNYGQAVPVDGGLIIDMTKMSEILEIGKGFVRVQAGALMKDINEALLATGQEMAMFPSTKDIATIGGFVAGGSVGIGSLANGALREAGNLMALTAMSVEAAPKEHEFSGTDVMKIHHAWGLNGVITEVTLRTVPTCDWIAVMVTFDNYRAAYSTAYGFATSDQISPKLVSVVDARIVDYFPRLNEHIRKGKDLVVSYVPREELSVFRRMAEAGGGHVDLAMDDAEREASSIPHAFEFCYNHTTLQVLKSDRSATYQQIGVPVASDADAIERLREDLGDEVWTHHEFYRLNGEVVSIDLPIIWYTTPERLADLNALYESHGFAVYDAHSNLVERGGLHSADYSHLAWKKRMDPKGLLNSAKSVAWPIVKDLSPEEIEAKSVEAPQ